MDPTDCDNALLLVHGAVPPGSLGPPIARAPHPRQANGGYEIRIAEETVRVEVDAGQIYSAPDSEPDTTIDLTRSGMRALILGASATEIEQAGNLSIQGQPATRPRFAQHADRTATTRRDTPTTRTSRRRRVKRSANRANAVR